MSRLKGTDVRARSGLPQAKLGPVAIAGSTSAPSDANRSPDEILNEHEESLNKVVDQAVGTLVQGMSDLVSLQRIEGRDHYHLEAQRLQSQIRSESMIKAAHDLLALSHSLKLMHVLGDTDTPGQIRAEQRQSLIQELRQLKALAER